jgi:isoleucyl-tRNA synthetase
VARFKPPAELRTLVSEKHLTRLENWPRLIVLRNEVLKALEIARREKVIGSPLDAKVCLATDSEFAPLLEDYQATLPTLFIASRVELGKDSKPGAYESELPGLRIRIEKAAGKKCARCWNYSERVGEDSRYAEVCERCSAALREIEGERESGGASRE